MRIFGYGTKAWVGQAGDWCAEYRGFGQARMGVSGCQSKEEALSELKKWREECK